jgi:hypothetical protein
VLTPVDLALAAADRTTVRAAGVPGDELPKMLGVSSVTLQPHVGALSISDGTLA